MVCLKFDKGETETLMMALRVQKQRLAGILEDNNIRGQEKYRTENKLCNTVRIIARIRRDIISHDRGDSE